MTTNREWLYSLDVAELADWFDAEHVEANDTLSAENDVRAVGVDANNENMDSREKLEADVYNHIAISITPNKDNDGVLAPYSTVLEWLDRQAAIAHREAFMRGRASLDDELAEYADEIAELAAERDALADDLLTCNRERESLRRALGVAIDHAHDILQLIDEGMA